MPQADHSVNQAWMDCRASSERSSGVRVMWLETAGKREPIRKLVFLEGNEESSSSIRMEEVPPVKALPSLMNLTHQAYVLEATGQRQENFLRCGRVLSQARAYRLIRPWGLDHLESTVDAVEKWLLEE